MSNELEMKFDSLEEIVIPVTIGNMKLLLHEASGEAAMAYRNTMMKGATLTKDGKNAQLGNVAEAELVLLSYCLTHENGDSIPLEVLKSWPNRIVKPLCDKAEEISELVKKKAEGSENPKQPGEQSS
jgi:hypothetical protein